MEGGEPFPAHPLSAVTWKGGRSLLPAPRSEKHASPLLVSLRLSDQPSRGTFRFRQMDPAGRSPARSPRPFLTGQHLRGSGRPACGSEGVKTARARGLRPLSSHRQPEPRSRGFLVCEMARLRGPTSGDRREGRVTAPGPRQRPAGGRAQCRRLLCLPCRSRKAALRGGAIGSRSLKGTGFNGQGREGRAGGENSLNLLEPQVWVGKPWKTGLAQSHEKGKHPSL